jgi:hypothetical protein
VCYFRFEGVNKFLVRENFSVQANNVSGAAIPAAPASPIVFASRVTFSTVLLLRMVMTRPSLPQFPPMSARLSDFFCPTFHKMWCSPGRANNPNGIPTNNATPTAGPSPRRRYRRDGSLATTRPPGVALSQPTPGLVLLSPTVPPLLAA